MKGQDIKMGGYMKCKVFLTVLAMSFLCGANVIADPVIQRNSHIPPSIAGISENDHSDMGVRGDVNDDGINDFPSGNNNPVVIRPLDPKLIDRAEVIGNFFKDSDGDGVTNMFDKCPDDKGPAETEGCPDTDEDGVWGAADLCPDEAAPDTEDGCPIADVEQKDVPPPPIVDAAIPPTDNNIEDNSNVDNAAALDAWGQGCSLVGNSGSSLNAIVSMLVFAVSIAPIAIRRKRGR